MVEPREGTTDPDSVVCNQIFKSFLEVIENRGALSNNIWQFIGRKTAEN